MVKFSKGPGALRPTILGPPNRTGPKVLDYGSPEMRSAAIAAGDKAKADAQARYDRGVAVSAAAKSPYRDQD